MKIIPFDLTIESINSLLYDKQITKVDRENLPWSNFIIPKSNENKNITYNNIFITPISDDFFKDFTIVNGIESIIIENNKRKIIKCKEFGDFENSVKRYDLLNIKLSASEIKLDKSNFNKEDNTESTTYDKKLLNDINKKSLKNTSLNITRQVQNNNPQLITQILLWAVEQNINYIYGIKEYRANAISDNYLLPYIYYTIIGA